MAQIQRNPDIEIYHLISLIYVYMVNMINRKGKWSGCRYICSEDNSAWLFNTVTDEVTQALTHFGLYHPLHFFFCDIDTPVMPTYQVYLCLLCKSMNLRFAVTWNLVEHPLYITIRSIIADTAERIRYSPLMKQWWQPMLLQDRPLIRSLLVLIRSLIQTGHDRNITTSPLPSAFST